MLQSSLLLSLALCGALLGALPPSAQTAPPVEEPTTLSAVDFDALLTRILPEPAELEWEAIGWQPSLAAAIVAAREAEKPILLWAMNGHPLGCV